MGLPSRYTIARWHVPLSCSSSTLSLERALGGIQDYRRGLQEAQPLDVLAVDLKEALDALGEITGEVTSQDILNQIFSSFCVGK